MNPCSSAANKGANGKTNPSVDLGPTPSKLDGNIKKATKRRKKARQKKKTL